MPLLYFEYYELMWRLTRFFDIGSKCSLIITCLRLKGLLFQNYEFIFQLKDMHF